MSKHLLELYAFFSMVFILFVDVITGIVSKELVIQEFIFDGFMILTLGAFGITTAGRIFKLKKQVEEKKEEEVTNEEELG
jgi:hypothetical protein